MEHPFSIFEKIGFEGGLDLCQVYARLLDKSSKSISLKMQTLMEKYIFYIFNLFLYKNLFSHGCYCIWQIFNCTRIWVISKIVFLGNEHPHKNNLFHNLDLSWDVESLSSLLHHRFCPTLYIIYQYVTSIYYLYYQSIIFLYGISLLYIPSVI